MLKFTNDSGPQPRRFAKDSVRSRLWFVGACCLLSCSLLLVPGTILADETQGSSRAPEDQFKPLFDGKEFGDWTGNKDLFRIEEHAIVGGSMKQKIPHNEFLTLGQVFKDFELRLEAKLIGEGGNAGIQIRSRRTTKEEYNATEKGKHIPEHEMVGYQVDMGKAWKNIWWGKLYDESRRRKVLAGPEEKVLEDLVRWDDWNDYRILCEGPRIRIWLNGKMTVDYTEQDDKIAREGILGLQIHGGPPSEAWYRKIRIREISAR